jgi:hypothetical protein
MRPKSTASERRRRASSEEIEFTEAIERYRRENRRPFPTWSEVLEVVRSLGYRKRAGATARETNGGWRQRCAELKEERDRLHLELLKLRDDYEAVCKAVIALMREDVEFDEDEVLAQIGKGQSLSELIAELEAEGGA